MVTIFECNCHSWDSDMKSFGTCPNWFSQHSIFLDPLPISIFLLLFFSLYLSLSLSLSLYLSIYLSLFLSLSLSLSYFSQSKHTNTVIHSLHTDRVHSDSWSWLYFIYTVTQCPIYNLYSESTVIHGPSYSLYSEGTAIHGA